MRKIIKFFRLKWIERKLLWLYIATIIEGQAIRCMTCHFPNIFHDKAEKIREEWYKVYEKKQ